MIWGNKKQVTASVLGRQVSCPFCDSKVFQPKNFVPSGTWAQALDFEGVGSEGMMLICTSCSRIEHFADKDIVDLKPTSQG